MKFLEQFASNRLNLPMRLVKLAMHFVPGPSKHGEIHSSPSVHRNAALLMVHWLGKADRTLGTSDPRCQDNIYSTTTVYDLLAQSFSSRILVRHSSLASPVACVLVLEKASSAFIAKCVFRRSVRFACWAFVVALFFSSFYYGLTPVCYPSQRGLFVGRPRSCFGSLNRDVEWSVTRAACLARISHSTLSRDEQ